MVRDYGDVIGTEGILQRMLYRAEMNSHSDVESVYWPHYNEPNKSTARMLMKDGTKVTVTVRTNYDPAKDPMEA